jgi:23S rRNA (uridine2552-2'-O)-methyltransferase
VPHKKSAKKKQSFLKRGNSRYDRHDAYYRQAKKDGYVARSIYKLEEIDEALGLVHQNDSVLDLGCAPGSWLQYVVHKVGTKKGAVVGIDLLEVEITFGQHVKIIQGDAFEATEELLRPPTLPDDYPGPFFDVVLSDMAPNTTGIKSVDQDRSLALCEQALYLAVKLLKPGGNFCVKILEGGGVQNYVKICRQAFTSVKIRRPKGTRVGSMETYVVALGLNNDVDPDTLW